jgi:hypothetical protein
LYNFGDCEAASEELKKEIIQAKKELRSKGVSIDAIN